MGLYGALEAGGTKMVCAAGDELGNIINRTSIPTSTPEQTIPLIIEYFKQFPIEALGIGAFGPVDLNTDSATYGYILDTPKLSWRQFNLVSALKNELHVPVGLDTDVNAACLGEVVYGSAKGLSNVLYLTIGTGIGAGVLSNGRLLHGMLHPEAGHIMLSIDPMDSFDGICPYHKHCFEGLACGPAIKARWGNAADELKEDEWVWELESRYIASALANYILILSPERIILGGGVMKQEQLFKLVRDKVLKILNGYLHTKQLGQIDEFIVPASLDGNQGILGAIALAKKAVCLITV